MKKKIICFVLVFLYKCKCKFKYFLKGMCEDHFDKRSLDLIDFEENNIE
jgi:hypothetical protein